MPSAKKGKSGQKKKKPAGTVIADARVVDGQLEVQFDKNTVEYGKVESHVDEDGTHCITRVTFMPVVGPDGRRWLTLDNGQRRPADELICDTHVAPRPHPDAWVEHVNGDLADDNAANLRWMTAEMAALPIPEGCFLVQDTMTVRHIYRIASMYVEPEERTKGVAKLEVEREETDAESVQKFMQTLDYVETAGNEVNGRPTPIMPAVLYMQNVGIVVRNAQGGRVIPPSGTPQNPTLYAPVGGVHVYAAFGPNIVARLYMPRVGVEATVALA
jgi:hypothetical protein